MLNLVRLLIDKNPESIYELLKLEKGKCKLYTYINAHNALQLRDEIELLEKFDYISSDGVFIKFISKWFLGENIERFSPDMSSIFQHLFKYAEDSSLSIYLIGSKYEEVLKSSTNIHKSYAGLTIAGISSGYFDQEETDKKIEEIIESKSDIVIVGMGVLRQEKFSLALKQAGFKGLVFTCGGFIHQSAKNLNYYPDIITKIDARFFYRLLDEPTKISKRLLISYPKFFFSFIYSFVKDYFFYPNE